MGRRILASLLAMALIFVLPVFSYADRGDIILKDSGSPVASTFSLRQSASTMSTRAVTLPSAPSGYYWEDVTDSVTHNMEAFMSGNYLRGASEIVFGSTGTYFVNLEFFYPVLTRSVYNRTVGSGYFDVVISGSTYISDFEIDVDSDISSSRLLFYSNLDYGSLLSPESTIKSVSIYKLESIPTYSITVSSSGNGTASASASSAYAGDIISLTATPDDGYIFSGWEVLSGNVSIINNQFTMPDRDVSVRANFVLPVSHSISVSSGGNGTASASVSSAVAGTVVTLSAEPEDGYVFGYWEVLAGNVSIINNQFTMPDSDVSIRANFIEYVPPNFISSGFTYELEMDDTSLSTTGRYFDFTFGNQPAGEYLINIYHEANSCVPEFEIFVGDKAYSTLTSGSVTSFIYNHVGGEMAFDGHFLITYSGGFGTSDGYIQGSQTSSSFNGSVTTYPEVSYSFEIHDIVAIPFMNVQSDDFSFFGSIIAWMRDFFDEQFNKIAGDDATKATVDNAASELEQEVQDLNTLSSDLTTQAGNLEQQFSTDFAIPSEISGFSGSVQSIYSFLFSSLGVFSIFIWLPIVLAVIKKLLRL